MQRVPDQVGDPLCILQVGLAPGHVGPVRSGADDQDESASRQRTPAVRKLSSEMAHRAVLFSGAHRTVLNLENVRIREVGMMSTLLKPLCGAFVIACGALGLIAGAGPLATPALAQAALAQTEPAPVQPQPEKPDHPRPRAGCR